MHSTSSSTLTCSHLTEPPSSEQFRQQQQQLSSGSHLSHIQVNHSFRPEQGSGGPDYGHYKQHQHPSQQQQQQQYQEHQEQRHYQQPLQPQQQQQQQQTRSYHQEQQQQPQQHQQQNQNHGQKMYNRSMIADSHNQGSSSPSSTHKSNHRAPQSDSLTQEGGPSRSHRRGPSTSLELNNHSVRFDPSRKYTTEATASLSSLSSSPAANGSSSPASEQGKSLARPNIHGQNSPLPCIACSMSRTPCDGGSPCRTCQLNRARCYYEGDSTNNMRYHDSNGNASPSGHQQQQQQQPYFNHHHHLNHQQQQGQDKGRYVADDRQRSHSGSHSSRSPSGSDSGSASGSGTGSSSSSNEGSNRNNSQERSSPSSFHGPTQHARVTPPQTSDYATVISIPPFQKEQEQKQEQDYPRQNNKVTLPSISSLSMGSSITPLTSASSLLPKMPSSSFSSSSLANSNSRSLSSSSSTPAASSFSSSSSSRPTTTTTTMLTDRELDGLSSSSSKPRPVRLILPAQSLSAPRLLQPTSFDDFSSKRHSLAKKHHTTPHHLQQQPPLSLTQNQQQQQRTSQTPGDVLYSLSTASIRARKNALEMENIQRANQLYEEYIAKIKAVSESISPAPTTTGGTIPIYQDDPMNSHRMDIDPTDFASNTGSYNPYPNKPARLSPLGEKDFGPIEGLERMLRSGMLHNLVQQYFTLIHPQFMILHKNQFLFRFWAEYGPFPEAYEIHNQFIEKPCSGSCAAEGDVVVHKASCSAVAAPAAMTEPSSSSQAPVKSSYRNSPLLLLSMMALVSRHLNDRSPMKSTIEEKHRRVQKSLSLYSHDQKVIEHRCQEKLQEGKLQELMETDEHGHRDLDGENFRDRGEQYFYWATELLKFEYEEPSLTVIQSLLLLREYAVMAGSHTQAYMYGGTAITMALVLGWDRAHLRQNTRNGAYGQSGSQEFAQGSEEEKVEQEKQRENKAKDEEQRLCWWQCFIVDRWMSAAYNRPVNIPVHVFDKTHLGPPPKIISISRPGDDSNTPSTTGKMDLEMLPMGLGVSSPRAVGLPPAQYRAKLFFDQQCRQALILDDILAFLSTWSEELFVNPAEFDKLSGALDEWHQDLADWQTFPLSGIVAPPKSSSSRPSTQKFATTIPVTTLSNDGSSRDNKQSQQERRDIVQSTLLGITFHTIRILLYRPFLRTNLRHPPCIPSRASLACAQSANAMTSLAESLINLTDATVQPCLLMRHQFSLVTAAGIQLMNASLEDEPRLSTPAKINLLKTIRILRDADRSTFGPPPQVGVGANGVRDGFHQVLRELFPGQMKHMPDLLGPSTSST